MNNAEQPDQFLRVYITLRCGQCDICAKAWYFILQGYSGYVKSPTNLIN